MLIKSNISFRAVEPEDIDLLMKWENDSESWHLSNTLIPFSRHDIEQFVLLADKDIFSTKQVRLMICLAIEDKLQTIGCIDLFDFEPHHKRAGIGILIDKNHRDKGYASIAIELLKDYAFNTLNLHQLYCNIEDDNKISLALFKKKNFEVSGLKKDWNLKSGKWVDEYHLQLINKY
ncbi:MAG: GNAT family N-acetyltransferase [Bacteroidetes bacterium]|nr:GNAT family N-acetyltransferase [Bacteroidota bacterium]